VPSLVRPLSPRNPQESHRSATPLELFADLCYVVAIAQAALTLHHEIVEGHAGAALVYFCLAFFGIWWAWLNFAWFNSAYDPDDTVHRLLTLLQVLGSLVLAAGVPRFFEQDFRLGVTGYVIMRIGLVLMWLRVVAGDPERRATARRYVTGLVVIQATWVVVVLVMEIPIWLFVVLAAADFAVPFLAEKAEPTPWHPHHIAERFGLFFIIVLGETVLSVALTLQVALDKEHPPTALAAVVAGGVLITFCAWWLYFSREDADVLTGNDVGFVWGFGHYVIFAGAAAFGAGLAARVEYYEHHAHVSDIVSSAFVAGPVAAFLAAWWFVCVRLHDASTRTIVPFSAAIVAVLALIWVPYTELWVGFVMVALLVVELVLTRDLSVAEDASPPAI
jgi:low temperature requirement protein LtrA